VAPRGAAELDSEFDAGEAANAAAGGARSGGGCETRSLPPPDRAPPAAESTRYAS